jgi:hypothetical protein
MQPGPHEHPFYRPLWRRLAIVGTCLVWACIETYYKATPLWLMLAWGVTAYAFWTFIVTYPKQVPPPENS